MALLAGEAKGLTRKAVEAALAGDPMALRLCIERILPRCRERSVKFALPPIESAGDVGRENGRQPSFDPISLGIHHGDFYRDFPVYHSAGEIAPFPSAA